MASTNHHPQVVVAMVAQVDLVRLATARKK
jgi:hypothetical protein